jgi:ABC-type molybdate transport system substrate-binding protein
LDVSAYLALGQRIEVGEQACPSPECERRRLGGWSGYWRWVRGPGTERLWIPSRRWRPTSSRAKANVRQLVAKVNLDEADAGVCYLTDVMPAVKPNVQEINIPDDLNTNADYPIATTKRKNPAGGQAFMAYVLSPAGQDILAKWGFT